MASTQRSFAQKLSKQHASDVRKTLVTCHMLTKTTDSMCSSTLSLTEPVDPLDYEEFLAQHINVLNRDPLKHILDFPPNDVSVKTVPRKIRTTANIVPKENIADLPPHVQECVSCYTRPWKIVEYSQRHYSSSCCARERIDRGTISPSAYQQDVRDRQGLCLVRRDGHHTHRQERQLHAQFAPIHRQHHHVARNDGTSLP